MSQTLPDSKSNWKTSLTQLIQSKGPVLIEIRFPLMGTSPDWHFSDDEGEVESLLDQLGPGAELHLHSVWDLKNSREPLVLKK